MFNIYKFFEVLGSISKEKIISKKWFYSGYALLFWASAEIWVQGFQLLCKQESCAVAGNELFVFAVRLGKES